ncbi:MAG: exodeoxyribonuclease III [Bacteroidetes bacterium]|nr:exodeoxyribonuclease III [Bacteroidota bacterium]
MKIISFNVNGVRAVVKKTFIEDMTAYNADVICLQETKANDTQVAEALQPLSGTYTIFSCSAERPGYSGTAVLTKVKPLSVSYGLGIAEHDTEGRLITCEFKDFYLINTYVPNSGSELARLDYRETWDEALLNYMLELEKKKPVVLCGDLNVAHQPIDLANPKSNYNKSAGYTQREIDGLSKFIAAGYKDTFRHFHADIVKYSWWSARFNSRAKNVGWRIDYFLASEKLLTQMNGAFILNDIMGSDHCPVGIDLNV